MTRVMYDSVDLGNIPRSTGAVALYIDGRFRNWSAGVRRFRKANHLSITVFGDLDAEMIDCEPGNVDAVQTAEWVRGKLKRGDRRPVCYGSRDLVIANGRRYGIPAILDELRKLGITRDQVRLGVAHYGFGPHMCSPRTCGAAFTADGTQHTETALGLNLDEWLLNDDFFPTAPRRRSSAGKAPVKKPKAKPVHKKVIGTTAAMAIANGILGVLHAFGIVHITGAEQTAITALAAVVGGAAAPAGYVPARN